MRKPVLIVAGVAVLGLLGGLLFKLQQDSKTSSGAMVAPSAATPAPGGEPAPAMPKSPMARAAPDGDGPPMVRVPTPGDATGTGNPMRIVRDHRGEENHAERSPIIPDTVAATRAGVTPYIKTCTEPFATAGKRGAMLVTVTATSKDGKVSFKDVKVKQKDLDDQALTDCVTKAYSQLVLDAPTGQGDAEYKLAMPFPVP